VAVAKHHVDLKGLCFCELVQLHDAVGVAVHEAVGQAGRQTGGATSVGLPERSTPESLQHDATADAFAAAPWMQAYTKHSSLTAHQLATSNSVLSYQ
jgi:hypothetical protein